MTKQESYQNKEQDRRITWLEEHWSTCNTEMGEIRTKLGKVETNVNWLVKSYWVIVVASVGALVAALFNLLLK